MRRILTFLVDSGPIVVLALLAYCGSFVHIRQTAVEHGQTGWMATAVAISIDLAGVVAARERQRDKKAGRGVGWPTTVLVGDVVLSLAANLDQAQSTMWGWFIAGTPCAAFAVCVCLGERRGSHRAARGVGEVREAPAFETAPPPHQRPAEPIQKPQPEALAGPSQETCESAGQDYLVGAANLGETGHVEPDDILPRAREVAEAYFAEHQKRISRDTIRNELGISTNRASEVLRQLKAAEA